MYLLAQNDIKKAVIWIGAFLKVMK